MPVNMLALMLQSAFRVVFERESLRLAVLIGVLPSLGAYIGTVLAGLTLTPPPADTPLSDAETLAALQTALLGAALGYLVAMAAAMPLAVRAAGDLLARKLGAPPAVLPGEAVRRGLVLFAQAVAVVVLVMMGGYLLGLLVPDGSAVASLALLGVMIASVYVFLGFLMVPGVLFYAERADIRASFALMRGQRLKLFLFVLVVAMPFIMAASLFSAIAQGQPDGAWVLALFVSLVGGFVNGLSTGPHLIGLVQAYFARTGRMPPSIIDQAEPRT
ncbi:hypothetical protein [Zavarzinia compransoris]|uniref:Uncharacterized protein n=1 Tax=Zavarzinia compransoris TaxID=1264899 RepID=A0A317E3F0_9PROT|nr:hypothetical protein [Zavarzinia compransoris]PWR20904.1 hypothetical protein DKG75_13010 [Zavarzinia compransoris]TDP44258.1 hypothetical protein DES42_10723 [Zavarzinia compransoris]